MIKGWGIDVSRWQGGKVDFPALKAAGALFVFIRIGCNRTKDKFFEQDYAAAVAAGLKVGAYFATFSTDDAGAVADATRVLGWLNNRRLDFPMAYDIEVDRQKGASRRNANSSMYNAFAAKLEAGGIYDAILYTGESFYNSYFNKAMITDDLWIAKYSTRQPSVGRTVAIWQYTSAEVNAPYYKGKLDRNYLYADSFQGSRAPEAKKSSNPYPVPTRTLKKKVPLMSGSDIKWLQWELVQRGYLPAQNSKGKNNIDGIYGADTRAAVLAFQRANELLADGICGSATRYALQQ